MANAAIKTVTEPSCFKQDISLLGGAFKDVTGVTVSRSEMGAVTLDLSALNVGVEILTNDDVRIVEQNPANNNKLGVIKTSVDKKVYNIGDVLPDGWIVGPISPTTGNPIAIEPKSGALDGNQTLQAGKDHAKKLRKQRGNETACLPDRDTLHEIYNEIVVAGHNGEAEFDIEDGEWPDKYWSSTPHPTVSGRVGVHYFSNGIENWFYTGDSKDARVRCIRDAPEISLAVPKPAFLEQAISLLKDDFKNVTVSLSETGALRIDVSALEGVDIKILTNGSEEIIEQTPANDNEPEVTQFIDIDNNVYNIGDALPDGWILGGISPTTGNIFSIEPKKDALEGNKTSDEGDEHARKLRKQIGNETVRRMDSKELSAVFKRFTTKDPDGNDRNGKAEFDTGKYSKIRSSTLHPRIPGFGRVLYLSDGVPSWFDNGGKFAQERLIRNEPGLRPA